MEALIEQYGLHLASALLGLAVAYGLWTIFRVITCPRPGRENAFEQERQEKIRAGSWAYRWFEPIIREWMPKYDTRGERLRQLTRCLKQSKEELPWRADEFLATKSVEGVLCALAIFAFLAVTGFVLFAAGLAFLLMMSYTWLAEKSVLSQAELHLKKIRLRMPFAIDQIALMMQAGADFENSLRTVVRDNADHPLSFELGEVLRQVSLGRPRSQALTDLRNRLEDKDVSDVVFAINKGEELGTPLSAILRDQADQMRLKRAQWGEKAAAEAEVQMVFPGMIVMVACLLVIMAPIVLPTLVTYLEQ